MSSVVQCLLVIAALFLCTEGFRLVDLSHVHTPDVYGIPLDEIPYTITTVFSMGNPSEGTYTEFKRFSSLELSGTHVEGSGFYGEDGRTVDEIPLEQTVAPGVVIDCRGEAAQDPEYSVPISKIVNWEAVYGRIPAWSAVLFNFGYSALYGNASLFFGTDNVADSTTFKFPSISLEAARFLIYERNVQILGADTISIDPYQINGQMTGLPIHREFLTQDGVIVESLRDLHLLPPCGFIFHAAPVKFQRASATPVRAYAVINY